MAPIAFNNTFYQLGDTFYSEVAPRGFEHPHLVSVNPEAAKLINLNHRDLQQDWFLQWASGNQTLPGSQPVAMVYSGHQFGGYSPQLGDGRGLLLGEVKGPGGQQDIHLKGAGLTPYSRFADGRAVLRSTIREYLCSEAVHGLGIPTTRALSIAGSDEPVYRETAETGAMLIRLSKTHLRFGSFEYFHHTGQQEAVKKLADYAIANYFPELTADCADSYIEMFRYSVHSTARLIAQWQSVGFAHGVMNTDNMSLLGETLDYGPFGFLDSYEPGFICNHSDPHGRYAFNRQPMIGLWNCNAFANALTSLISVEALTAVLEEYEQLYLQQLLALQRLKLGLTDHQPDDQQLIDELLKALAENRVDYSIFFRQLCYFDEAGKANTGIRDLFLNREAFDHWAQRYRQRLTLESQDRASRQRSMLRTNPKYVFRNYMAEIAIRKARDEQNYSEIERMLRLLQSPFDEHPDSEEYARHPPAWSQQLSVSCSS